MAAVLTMTLAQAPDDCIPGLVLANPFPSSGSTELGAHVCLRDLLCTQLGSRGQQGLGPPHCARHGKVFISVKLIRARWKGHQ